MPDDTEPIIITAGYGYKKPITAFDHSMQDIDHPKHVCYIPDHARAHGTYGVAAIVYRPWDHLIYIYISSIWCLRTYTYTTYIGPYNNVYTVL